MEGARRLVLSRSGAARRYQCRLMASAARRYVRLASSTMGRAPASRRTACTAAASTMADAPRFLTATPTARPSASTTGPPATPVVKPTVKDDAGAAGVSTAPPLASGRMGADDSGSPDVGWSPG